MRALKSSNMFGQREREKNRLREREGWGDVPGTVMVKM